MPEEEAFDEHEDLPEQHAELRKLTEERVMRIIRENPFAAQRDILCQCYCSRLVFFLVFPRRMERIALLKKLVVNHRRETFEELVDFINHLYDEIKSSSTDQPPQSA